MRVSQVRVLHPHLCPPRVAVARRFCLTSPRFACVCPRVVPPLFFLSPTLPPGMSHLYDGLYSCPRWAVPSLPPLLTNLLYRLKDPWTPLPSPLSSIPGTLNRGRSQGSGLGPPLRINPAPVPPCGSVSRLPFGYSRYPTLRIPPHLTIILFRRGITSLRVNPEGYTLTRVSPKNLVTIFARYLP